MQTQPEKVLVGRGAGRFFEQHPNIIVAVWKRVKILIQFIAAVPMILQDIALDLAGKPVLPAPREIYGQESRDQRPVSREERLIFQRV